MYRFSQLIDSSELREQFVDLKLKSESKTVEDDDDKCSRSTITKSKKGKHRNTSKNLREPGKSCNSDSVLKDSGDVTKNEYSHLHLEPCGFRNVRNSCFLNASLQLLLNIPPLCTAVNKYTNVSINNDGVSNTNDNKKTPLINQLLELIDQLKPHTEGNDTTAPPSITTTMTTTATNKCRQPRESPSNKTKARSNVDVVASNSISSNSKLSNHGNGVQPYALNHSLTLNPIFAQLLHMDSGVQEDTAECLTYLLTQLHEEMSNSSKPAMPKSSTTAEVQLNEVERSHSDESDWMIIDRAGKHYPQARKIELDGGQSPISSLFCGTLVTRSNLVKSSPVGNPVERGRKKVSVKEPFFILPVPIDDPSATSVECSLRCLAEPEQITDYQDSLGGQQAVVHRRSTLDRLPPYLILQLKRFYNESKPQSSVKMNVNGTVNITHNDDIVRGGGIRQTASSAIIRKHLKSVNIQSKLVIPKELLSQETRFNSSQRHYRLLAVIFHVGETVASGHYTIAVHISNHLIKNGENSTAFLYFDDDRACILNTPESVNLLLSTHRPLDTRSCTFLPLPSSSSSKQQQSRVDFGSTVNSQHTPTSSVVYSTQPRTPYILVYESQTVYSPAG